MTALTRYFTHEGTAEDHSTCDSEGFVSSSTASYRKVHGSMHMASHCDSAGFFERRSAEALPPAAEAAPQTRLANLWFPTCNDFDSKDTYDRQKPVVTTLMIANLPCVITQERLAEVVASLGYGKKHDYLYVPTRHVKNKPQISRGNFGFGFINFKDPKDAAAFMVDFTGYRFRDLRSKKICEVRPAHVQGLEANRDQFALSNKKVLYPDDSDDSSERCVPFTPGRVDQAGFACDAFTIMSPPRAAEVHSRQDVLQPMRMAAPPGLPHPLDFEKGAQFACSLRRPMPCMPSGTFRIQ